MEMPSPHSLLPRSATGFVGGPEHRDARGRLRHPAAGELPPVGELHEVESLDVLMRLLERGGALRGVRLQGLDLTGPEVTTLLMRASATDLDGLVVLGGRLTAAVEHHLRAGGAVLFPDDPTAPVPVFRAHLYTADELYAGLERGYESTPDARAYAWLQDARLREDAYVTLLRAIHDDSVTDALVQALAGRRVVGVMGGHALQRGTPGYAGAARLGHALAGGGHTVITGGGPGAMEAANLGAWATSTHELDAALSAVAAVPSFRPDVGAWAQAALACRAAGSPRAELRSVGIPTWFYGHEPPNVFGDLIAKLFSNAVREDLLLAHSNAGVVVLPGAAGTVQEVFQLCTRLYYAGDEPSLPPLVLVGRDHWSRDLPVWPLVQALGRDREMGRHVHLVETPEEALAVIDTPGADAGLAP